MTKSGKKLKFYYLIFLYNKIQELFDNIEKNIFEPFGKILEKISIFDQIFDFRPKFRFSTKILIFYQKFGFLTKISSFDQNFDFRQKFRF